MSDTVRVYYDADTDKSRLSGRTFAVVGYGSQGHAHAPERARVAPRNHCSTNAVQQHAGDARLP